MLIGSTKCRCFLWIKLYLQTCGYDSQVYCWRWFNTHYVKRGYPYAKYFYRTLPRFFIVFMSKTPRQSISIKALEYFRNRVRKNNRMYSLKYYKVSVLYIHYFKRNIMSYLLNPSYVILLIVSVYYNWLYTLPYSMQIFFIEGIFHQKQIFITSAERRRLYSLPLLACLLVCLFIKLRQTDERIFIYSFGQVGHDTISNLEHFGTLKPPRYRILFSIISREYKIVSNITKNWWLDFHEIYQRGRILYSERTWAVGIAQLTHHEVQGGDKNPETGGRGIFAPTADRVVS